MWQGMAISAGLGLLSEGIGAALAAGDNKKAEKLYEEALKQYGPENVPPLEYLKAQLQGRTEFDRVQGDSQAVAAQRAALATLEARGRLSGLDADDRATLAAAQAQSAQQERGQREAILQNARSRGIAGSGLELQASLQAQQAGADRANQAGVALAESSRARALQALEASGQLAGQMRSQSHQEQAARASAQDAINRFNSDLTNSTNINNQKLRQQHYENEFRERDALAAAQLAEANRRKGKAASKRAAATAFGSSASNMVNSYAGWGGSDKDGK